MRAVRCHEKSYSSTLRQGQEQCDMCNETKSINRLFFDCVVAKLWWIKILEWLRFDHVPGTWQKELTWILGRGKGRRPKCRVMVANSTSKTTGKKCVGS